jgi:hypothetical protein
MNFEIAEHTFNSNWYGRKFGISRDINLLEATSEVVETACAGYAVVELRLPTTQIQTKCRYLNNGFLEVDLQIEYRLNTKKFAKFDSEIVFLNSEDCLIDFSDFSDFSSERYLQLPAVTEERNSLRYATWASELMRIHPRTCGTVRYKNATLGYVFGSTRGEKGQFALGVSSRKSPLPGLALYQAAMRNFYENGAKSVSASFSATNIGALNLHASLGCRFISSSSIYFRINPD